MKILKSTSYLITGLLFTFLLVAPYQATAQVEKSIFQSVVKGDAYSLEAVIQNGADVNQTTKLGNTPLMAAAKVGDRAVLEILLSNEADVNAQNLSGATALMIAAKYGHPHVIDMLLEHGADPLLKTKRGYTASVFAQGYRYPEIHTRLLKAEKSYKKLTKNRKQLTGS